MKLEAGEFLMASWRMSWVASVGGHWQQSRVFPIGVGGGVGGWVCG